MFFPLPEACGPSRARSFGFLRRCAQPGEPIPAHQGTGERNQHWKRPFLFRAARLRERLRLRGTQSQLSAASAERTKIEATFGTEFQRTVAIKNLNELLAAWKQLVEAKHNKNAVIVSRSRD